MGRTMYVPDDIEEPFLAAADGDLDAAKEDMLDTLEENAPAARASGVS